MQEYIECIRSVGFVCFCFFFNSPAMNVKFPANNQDVVQTLQNYPTHYQFDPGEDPGKLEVLKWCVIKQSCIRHELLVVPKQCCLFSSKLNLVALQEISATDSVRYHFEGRGGLF